MIGFTGRVEEKYEKRHKDGEEKNTHWRQKVDNVCVVLVEEQFGHLEKKGNVLKEIIQYLSSSWPMINFHLDSGHE